MEVPRPTGSVLSSSLPSLRGRSYIRRSFTSFRIQFGASTNECPDQKGEGQSFIISMMKGGFAYKVSLRSFRQELSSYIAPLPSFSGLQPVSRAPAAQYCVTQQKGRHQPLASLRAPEKSGLFSASAGRLLCVSHLVPFSGSQK